MGRCAHSYCNEEDIFSYKESYYRRSVRCDYCGSELKNNEIVNGKCPNCNAPINSENDQTIEAAIGCGDINKK